MLFFTEKLLITLCFVCCISFSNGQVNDQSDHDSTYYTSYPELITARFYFSQKYTNFTVGAQKITPDLLYHPNTSLNMGVGATYRSVTLNLAYGFLNKDNTKGKTRYLDLQSHLYSRKWAIDLNGQFYKGYYLNNKSTGYPGNQDYYVRPDIRISLSGASAYRIINDEKFSLRAATLQNEWQQKSSGSLLIGAEIFYGTIRADSAFVPSLLAERYDQKDIHKIHLLKFGPGAGYAYTFVYEKHFYLTWALTANINAGSVKEFSNGSRKSKFTFTPNYNYRFALGYNGSVWACNLMLVGNQINFKGASSLNPYDIKTGNFRINLTKRLMPGSKLKEKIRFLDDFLDR
jgi:hypothetical protein